MSAARIHHLICFALLAASLALAAPVGVSAQKARGGQKRQPDQAKDQSKLDPRAAAEFNRLSKQASEARAASRLDDAIALYNQALRLKPRWPDGWWYLGSIFYDRDRYFEAREALRNYLALLPQSGPGWALTGLCEFQLRDYEHALADINQARKLGIGSKQEFIPVLNYHLGILLTRFEQFELAFEPLLWFIRQHNESPRIIEALGLNLLRMPFLPTEYPPEKREVVLLAGRAAYYAGGLRPTEAQQAFDELRRRYPDAPNVHYAYGTFLLASDPNAALEEFRQELKASPAHLPSLLQMAFEYIKQNNYEAARPFAEKSLQLASDSPAARNAMGNVLLETGDVEGAIKQLEKGVEIDPSSPEMHFTLAKAYRKAKRLDDAKREQSTFLRLDSERRTQREGAQSVGGLEAKPVDKSPPQR